MYWVLLLRHHLGAYGPYMKGSGRRAGENRTAAEILALLAGRQQQAKALLNKLDRWVSPSWLDGNPLWDLAAELVPKWIRA